MKITKNLLMVIAAIVGILALIIVADIGYYNALVAEMTDAGSATFKNLDSRATMTSCFVETMTTYADNYLENGGARKDSPYFSLIRENEESNDYSMDLVGGTQLENMTGNLTGVGTVPMGGPERQEMNLALSFNDYFRHLYDRMPEIAWIYYTSEQGFMNLYPWTASSSAKYTASMKNDAFYTVVTPENNPAREPVWTKVYLDAAGKGPMITLSSPVYYGDKFCGVISIDYTTAMLQGLLKSSYPTYLLNANNEVIAAGGFTIGADKSYVIKDILRFSDTELQLIQDAESGKVSLIGINYIYKAKLTDMPMTLIMITPRLNIVMKSIVKTLPIIFTGIMLGVTLLVIMKLRRTRDKLRDSALTDPLTGLKNRRFLDTIMETEIARADRYKQSMSMLCLDLDHFKNVNDTWGHPIGDEVLLMTAVLVKQTIRESDVVVRLGGEEFIVLLPQTGIEAALEAAERIRKAIEAAKHPIAGKFTVSVGVIERNKGESYTGMYKRVDEALYLAKNAGRNCVKAYDDKAESGAVTINLEWNNAWNCGEETIDRQHQELVVFMNRLMGLVSLDKPKAGALLSLVVVKIAEHFDYEEKVLTELDYPELEHHLNEHKRLLELARTVSEAYLAGVGKAQSVTTFIVDEIIVGHLLEEDVKFFPYIKEAAEAQKVHTMTGEKMTSDAFWELFLRETGRDPATRYYESFYFTTDETLADKLLELVLAGKKLATASSLLCYEKMGTRPPQPGDMSIVTDWSGNPRCVIETTAVNVYKFRDITFDICRREGEDDSLESWRQGHARFFIEDGRELGYTFSEEMPVLFEDFRVLFVK